MALPPTNFEHLGKGPPPRVGDVFEARFGDRRLLGRVLALDAVWDPRLALRAVVVSFFGPVPDSWSLETGDRQVLQIENALRPPFMAADFGWKRGYFRTLGNVDFLPGEAPEVLAFKTGLVSLKPNSVVNEKFESIDPKGAPVGRAACYSYPMIDDVLSDHFGIPKATDSH